MQRIADLRPALRAGDPPSGFLLVPSLPLLRANSRSRSEGSCSFRGQKNRFGGKEKGSVEGAEAAMVETRTESGRPTLAKPINEHMTAQRAANSVVKEREARRLETDLAGTA